VTSRRDRSAGAGRRESARPNPPARVRLPDGRGGRRCSIGEGTCGGWTSTRRRVT